MYTPAQQTSAGEMPPTKNMLRPPSSGGGPKGESERERRLRLREQERKRRNDGMGEGLSYGAAQALPPQMIKPQEHLGFGFKPDSSAITPEGFQPPLGGQQPQLGAPSGQPPLPPTTPAEVTGLSKREQIWQQKMMERQGGPSGLPQAPPLHQPSALSIGEPASLRPPSQGNIVLPIHQNFGGGPPASGVGHGAGPSAAPDAYQPVQIDHLKEQVSRINKMYGGLAGSGPMDMQPPSAQPMSLQPPSLAGQNSFGQGRSPSRGKMGFEEAKALDSNLNLDVPNPFQTMKTQQEPPSSQPAGFLQVGTEGKSLEERRREMDKLERNREYQEYLKKQEADRFAAMPSPAKFKERLNSARKYSKQVELPPASTNLEADALKPGTNPLLHVPKPPSAHNSAWPTSQTTAPMTAGGQAGSSSGFQQSPNKSHRNLVRSGSMNGPRGEAPGGGQSFNVLGQPTQIAAKQMTQQNFMPRQEPAQLSAMHHRSGSARGPSTGRGNREFSPPLVESGLSQIGNRQQISQEEKLRKQREYREFLDSQKAKGHPLPPAAPPRPPLQSDVQPSRPPMPTQGSSQKPPSNFIAQSKSIRDEGYLEERRRQISDEVFNQIVNSRPSSSYKDGPDPINRLGAPTQNLPSEPSMVPMSLAPPSLAPPSLQVPSSFQGSSQQQPPLHLQDQFSSKPQSEDPANFFFKQHQAEQDQKSREANRKREYAQDLAHQIAQRSHSKGAPRSPGRPQRSPGRFQHPRSPGRILTSDPSGGNYPGGGNYQSVPVGDAQPVRSLPQQILVNERQKEIERAQQNFESKTSAGEAMLSSKQMEADLARKKQEEYKRELDQQVRQRQSSAAKASNELPPSAGQPPSLYQPFTPPGGGPSGSGNGAGSQFDPRLLPPSQDSAPQLNFPGEVGARPGFQPPPIPRPDDLTGRPPLHNIWPDPSNPHEFQKPPPVNPSELSRPSDLNYVPSMKPPSGFPPEPLSSDPMGPPSGQLVNKQTEQDLAKLRKEEYKRELDEQVKLKGKSKREIEKERLAEKVERAEDSNAIVQHALPQGGPPSSAASAGAFNTGVRVRTDITAEKRENQAEVQKRAAYQEELRIQMEEQQRRKDEEKAKLKEEEERIERDLERQRLQLEQKGKMEILEEGERGTNQGIKTIADRPIKKVNRQQFQTSDEIEGAAKYQAPGGGFENPPAAPERPSLPLDNNRELFTKPPGLVAPIQEEAPLYKPFKIPGSEPEMPSLPSAMPPSMPPSMMPPSMPPTQAPGQDLFGPGPPLGGAPFGGSGLPGGLGTAPLSGIGALGMGGQETQQIRPSLIEPTSPQDQSSMQAHQQLLEDQQRMIQMYQGALQQILDFRNQYFKEAMDMQMQLMKEREKMFAKEINSSLAGGQNQIQNEEYSKQVKEIEQLKAVKDQLSVLLGQVAQQQQPMSSDEKVPRLTAIMNPSVQNNLNQLIKSQRDNIVRMSQTLSFRNDQSSVEQPNFMPQPLPPTFDQQQLQPHQAPDYNSYIEAVAMQPMQPEIPGDFKDDSDAFDQSLDSKSKLIRIPKRQFANKLKEKADEYQQLRAGNGGSPTPTRQQWHQNESITEQQSMNQSHLSQGAGLYQTWKNADSAMASLNDRTSQPHWDPDHNRESFDEGGKVTSPIPKKNLPPGAPGSSLSPSSKQVNNNRPSTNLIPPQETIQELPDKEQNQEDNTNDFDQDGFVSQAKQAAADASPLQPGDQNQSTVEERRAQALRAKNSIETDQDFNNRDEDLSQYSKSLYARKSKASNIMPEAAGDQAELPSGPGGRPFIASNTKSPMSSAFFHGRKSRILSPSNIVGNGMVNIGQALAASGAQVPGQRILTSAKGGGIPTQTERSFFKQTNLNQSNLGNSAVGGPPKPTVTGSSFYNATMAKTKQQELKQQEEFQRQLMKIYSDDPADEGASSTNTAANRGLAPVESNEEDLENMSNINIAQSVGQSVEQPQFERAITEKKPIDAAQFNWQSSEMHPEPRADINNTNLKSQLSGIPSNDQQSKFDMDFEVVEENSCQPDQASKQSRRSHWLKKPGTADMPYGRFDPTEASQSEIPLELPEGCESQQDDATYSCYNVGTIKTQIGKSEETSNKPMPAATIGAQSSQVQSHARRPSGRDDGTDAQKYLEALNRLNLEGIGVFTTEEEPTTAMLVEQDKDLASISKLQPGQFQTTEDKAEREKQNQQIDALYEQAMAHQTHQVYPTEEVKEEFSVHDENEPTSKGSLRQQVQGAMRSPESPPRPGRGTAAAQQNFNFGEEEEEETFGVHLPTQQTEKRAIQDRASARGLPMSTGKRDPILDSTEGARGDNLLMRDDQTESYFRDADFEQPTTGVLTKPATALRTEAKDNLDDGVDDSHQKLVEKLNKIQGIFDFTKDGSSQPPSAKETPQIKYEGMRASSAKQRPGTTKTENRRYQEAEPVEQDLSDDDL